MDVRLLAMYVLGQLLTAGSLIFVAFILLFKPATRTAAARAASFPPRPTTVRAGPLPEDINSVELSRFIAHASNCALDRPGEPSPAETCQWLNAFLSHVIAHYRIAPEFHSRLLEELDHAFNHNRPSFVGQVKLTQVFLGALFPVMKAASARIVPNGAPFNAGGFAIDVDFEYSDDLSLSIETQLEIRVGKTLFATLPIQLTVGIRSIKGAMTLSLSGSALIVSFREQPEIEFEVASVVGHSSPVHNVAKLTDMLVDRLDRAVYEKLVFPGGIRIGLAFTTPRPVPQSPPVPPAAPGATTAVGSEVPSAGAHDPLASGDAREAKGDAIPALAAGTPIGTTKTPLAERTGATPAAATGASAAALHADPATTTPQNSRIHTYVESYAAAANAAMSSFVGRGSSTPPSLLRRSSVLSDRIEPRTTSATRRSVAHQAVTFKEMSPSISSVGLDSASPQGSDTEDAQSVIERQVDSDEYEHGGPQDEVPLPLADSAEQGQIFWQDGVVDQVAPNADADNADSEDSGSEGFSFLSPKYRRQRRTVAVDLSLPEGEYHLPTVDALKIFERDFDARAVEARGRGSDSGSIGSIDSHRTGEPADSGMVPDETSAAILLQHATIAGQYESPRGVRRRLFPSNSDPASPSDGRGAAHHSTFSHYTLT